MSLEDISNPEYTAFVEKFKPKKTTDDCYTPELIYEVVADYVTERYGVDREIFVRPFWPGGDYKRFDYPEGCVVVDNPPFSKITQICRDYMENGIRYFLFCPYLCSFSPRIDDTVIVTASDVTYENGAKVGTSFRTNMEPGIRARSDAELAARIKDADAANRRQKAEQLLKYAYPDDVLTASMLGYLAVHGISHTVRSSDSYRIAELDSQRAAKKIYSAVVTYCRRRQRRRDGHSLNERYR